MPKITVKSLADTVKVPVARLLREMQAAGLPHSAETDFVSVEQKLQLLEHLKDGNRPMRGSHAQGRPSGLERVLAVRRAEIAQKTGNPATSRASDEEKVGAKGGEHARRPVYGGVDMEQFLTSRYAEIAQEAGDLTESDGVKVEQFLVACHGEIAKRASDLVLDATFSPSSGAALPRMEDDIKRAKLAIEEKERQINRAVARLSSLRDSKSQAAAAEAELKESQDRLHAANDLLAQYQKEIAEAQEALTKLEASPPSTDTLPAITQQITDVNKRIEVAEQDRSRLTARRDELAKKEAEFQERRQLLEQSRQNLESILAETEEAHVQINSMPEANFGLRVSDTGQAFHEAVQRFLQSEEQACSVMRRIQDVLRHHHADNDQILDALKLIGEADADDLAAAIHLSSELADGLGSFDRRLKAMTKELDSRE